MEPISCRVSQEELQNDSGVMMPMFSEEDIRNCAKELLSNRDTALIALDPIKKDQLIPLIADAFSLFYKAIKQNNEDEKNQFGVTGKIRTCILFHTAVASLTHNVENLILDYASEALEEEQNRGE